MMINKRKKVEELKRKLKDYEKKLDHEMKGYRGVIHESASSELKHTKVMVYRARVQDLKEEIKDLNNES